MNATDDAHVNGSRPDPLNESADSAELIPNTSDPFEAKWCWLGSKPYLTERPKARDWLLWRNAKNDEEKDASETISGVGVLPLGKVGMLVAAGGAGKTMALVQLALAVASGTKWLGLNTLKGGGRVLLALAEEDAEEMHRRIYNAAQAMKLSPEQSDLVKKNIALLPLANTPVAFVRDGGNGDVTRTEVLGALRARLEREADEAGEGWRLLVLDPLSRFAGAEAEKDNAAATRFVEAVETLVAVKGSPTVLVAHHTNKLSRVEGQANGAVAARGASGLTDGVRWVANLDTDVENVAVLRFTKSNYSPPAPSIMVRRLGQYGGALQAMTEADCDAHEKKKKDDADQKAAEKRASKPPANGTTSPSNVEPIFR